MKAGVKYSILCMLVWGIIIALGAFYLLSSDESYAADYEQQAPLEQPEFVYPKQKQSVRKKNSIANSMAPQLSNSLRRYWRDYLNEGSSFKYQQQFAIDRIKKELEEKKKEIQGQVEGTQLTHLLWNTVDERVRAKENAVNRSFQAGRLKHREKVNKNHGMVDDLATALVEYKKKHNG